METTNPEKANLVEQARAALGLGKAKKALRLVQEGLKGELADAHKAELNRVAAEALSHLGELEHARIYVEQARGYAMGSGDYRVLYNIALTAGNVLARMNNYGGADMMYSEALTMAGMGRDTFREARVLMNISMLDQRRGNHARALDVLGKLMPRLEKAGRKRIQAVCYSRMAYSYLEAGKLDEARQSILKLQEHAQELGDRWIEASLHYRKGSLCLKQDNYKTALNDFEKASTIYRDLSEAKNLALVLTDMAECYIKLGEADKSIPLLDEAAALACKADSPDLFCKAYVLSAERSTANRAWKDASEYYRKALKEAEVINNPDRFRYFHQSLSEVIAEAGPSIPGIKNVLSRLWEKYLKLGLEEEAKETEDWLSDIPLAD